MRKSNEEMTLEQAIEKLEEITSTLSSESTNIDVSIQLYKDAKQLIKDISKKLDEVKGQIKVIDNNVNEK